jgi:hypothetical protein
MAEGLMKMPNASDYSDDIEQQMRTISLLKKGWRIRREEQLPVFERLGDVRSRAVTLGQIAHILARQGDLSDARALQVERLGINRQLDDADGIGATLWDLAQLDLAEQ